MVESPVSVLSPSAAKAAVGSMVMSIITVKILAIILLFIMSLLNNAIVLNFLYVF